MRRSGSGGGTPTPSNPGNVADWDLTLFRYFLVDYDGGDDANTGYVDAAAGATIVPTGLAKKTMPGLMAILPRDGNGRKTVVLVKNRAAGAVYLDVDGVTQSAVDFSGCYGYAFAASRASSDLTNSATDKILLGAVVGYTGPNGDGSWTAAAGATVKQLTVAAGTLPAEGVSGTALDSYIGGMRIRFKGNVNAALANVVTNVWKNGAGTSTIEFGQDIAGIPGTGEQFFIERVGTRFASFVDFSNTTVAAASTTTSSLSNIPAGFTVGFGCAAATNSALKVGGPPGSAFQTYGFMEVNGGGSVAAQTRPRSRVQFAASYTDEAGTSRNCGVGVRSKGLLFLTQFNDLQIGARGLHTIGGLFVGLGVLDVSIGGGNAIWGGASVTPINQQLGAYIGNQNSATIAKLRIVGAANLAYGTAGMVVGGRVSVSGCEWQDCSTGPCVLVVSQHLSGLEPTFVSLEQGTTAAAGGNTQYGVTISAFGSVVSIASNFTVTGTLGDIRFSLDSVITTYAGLLRTNVIDRSRNNVTAAVTSAASGIITSCCIPVTNSSGGAMAVGDVVRGNGTTGQVTNAQGDTLANSAVLGVMVTPPAAGAVGYMTPPGTAPSVTCTSAPTAGAIVYLSVGTAARGVTTEPVLSGTQQKVKLGRCVSVSGSNARVTFTPDIKPENTLDYLPIPAEISNAAASFSATQTWLIATGTYSVDRAFTLEAASTLSVGTVRTVSDMTSGGAFNILLTPNAADGIDGGANGVALAIPCGSKQTIRLRLTPTLKWKIE